MKYNRAKKFFGKFIGFACCTKQLGSWCWRTARTRNHHYRTARGIGPGNAWTVGRRAMSEVQDKAQRQFGDVKETRANKMFTSALLPFAIHWIQVTACKQNSHRRPFAPAPRAPAAAADRIATATVMIIVKGLTPHCIEAAHIIVTDAACIISTASHAPSFLSPRLKSMLTS